MSNSGQTCSAWTRMLVHADQYDEAVAARRRGRRQVRSGRADRPASSTPSSATASRGYIEKGVAEGARLVAGGPDAPAPRQGYYVSPTVFADVTPEMTIAQEEIFGPVAVRS